MTATETPLLGQEPIDLKEKETAPDDLRLWSVTTIIGVLDKPALLYWAAEQAAKAAVAVANSLPTRIDEDGEAETVKWLRDARWRRPKDELSDTEFGTQLHVLCEQYALTGQRPEVKPAVFKGDVEAATKCLDQFDRWLHEFQPEYQATEVVVYTPEFRIAGTTDAFFTIDGTRFIVDYKSSKKSYGADGKPSPIYPETALQLAGYRYAEMAATWRPRRFESFRRRYYLLSQTEQDLAVPVPEVDGGIGLKITPEHCTAYPVRCDERVYEAFLFCLEVARYQFEMAKNVVGEAMTKPEVA